MGAADTVKDAIIAGASSMGMSMVIATDMIRSRGIAMIATNIDIGC
jgi:hypothetical protein